MRRDSHGPRGPGAGGGLLRRRRTWIKTTSRMGVWGLVVATLPALSKLVGAPVRPGVSNFLGAGGLLTSGLGVGLASVLVLHAKPSGPPRLKLAAIAGVPLGVALMMGGAVVMKPLGPFADAVDAAGPIVLLVGVGVVGLLLTGFLGSP